MARFDVCRLRAGLILDCQADMLHGMPTRFVIPLEPVHPSLFITDQLNPRFIINGEPLLLVTQLAGTVRTRDIAGRLASLSDEHDQRAVQRAIDMLTGSDF